jgi:hypothetical protein
MRSLEAPHGIANGGELTCECGFRFRYERLVAALNKHERHAVLATIFDAGAVGRVN